MPGRTHTGTRREEISESPDFYTRLGAGDRLVCDLSYIP